MGFDDFIPPFATANGSRILKGVNYASGTAGILDETAQHMVTFTIWHHLLEKVEKTKKRESKMHASSFQGTRIPLNQQLGNHKTTTAHITDILGNKNIAQRYLRQCLYLMVAGSNDYINNYFLPHIYNTSRVYTPEQYARFLINKYAKEIKVWWQIKCVFCFY